MQLKPLISIIIPCYNYGRFLSDALDSILQQSYKNWECIIVDDGSVDNTKDVSEKYLNLDSRFKYIYQVNSGLAGARNTALHQSKGKYVQLLDADDMLEPDKLMLQTLLFEANNDLDLIYSNMLLFNNNDGDITYKPYIMQVPIVSGKGEELISQLIYDNFFLPGCVIFKRELFERTGFFKPEMGGLEDWNYWFRAALAGGTFYNDSRNGTHLLIRVHGDNMSAKHKSMELGRIKAREDLIQVTKDLQKQGKLTLNPTFINKINALHKMLLNRDKARYNLFYNGIFDGIIQALKHAYYSRRPFFAFYDAAYWLKERIKRSVAAEQVL